jgi:hypothetical protein
MNAAGLYFRLSAGSAEAETREWLNESLSSACAMPKTHNASSSYHPRKYTRFSIASIV